MLECSVLPRAPIKRKRGLVAKTANKTTLNNHSVKDFIAQIEDHTRRADAQAVAALMEDVTGESPAMWGTAIVGFGAYHYKYESGREGDMPKIGFSPRKNALVLYLMLGAGSYAPLLDKLGKHKTGKGCLYIGKLDEVDQTVLRELITNAYAHMTEKYG